MTMINVPIYPKAARTINKWSTTQRKSITWHFYSSWGKSKFTTESTLPPDYYPKLKKLSSSTNWKLPSLSSPSWIICCFSPNFIKINSTKSSRNPTLFIILRKKNQKNKSRKIEKTPLTVPQNITHKISLK